MSKINQNKISKEEALDSAGRLRKYNDWRTGKDERTMDEAGVIPSVITSDINILCGFIESLTRNKNIKRFFDQYIECTREGFCSNSRFYAFKDNLEKRPAFKTINESGVNITICGRFGGHCSSENKECQKMRGIL